MQSLLNLFHSVPTSVWALVGAAIAVSGVMQTLKHWFFKQLSPSALVSITSALSLLAAGVQYFTQAVHSNPGVLGVHTAAIFAGTQWAYRYLISPLYSLMVDANAHRASQGAQTPAAANAVTTPEASF